MKLFAALPASKYGALHYRNIENDKIIALKENFGKFDAEMNLSPKGIIDIKW